MLSALIYSCAGVKQSKIARSSVFDVAFRDFRLLWAAGIVEISHETTVPKVDWAAQLDGSFQNVGA